MPLKRILRRVRRAQRPIVRGTQIVLLHVSLFLLYYIGFTLARLVLSVAARRLLHHRPRRPPSEDTWWREAEGYDLDPVRLTRQS
jgi:hypothetical protein